MRVLISGSSGLIGSALVRALEQEGHQVRRLIRSSSSQRLRGGQPPHDAGSVALWDPSGGTIEVRGLEGVEAAVHLAGAGIGDRRWSPVVKRLILDSRVKSTGLLAETLAALDPRPRTLLSASATGYYGDRGDQELSEASRPGSGFLAQVCQAWEAATAPAKDAGMRVVHLRSGVVLHGSGGALAKQLPLFRLGLGGRLGSGRQYLSWISLADELGAILHVLGHDELNGAVNATAPEPSTNADFTATLARVLSRPALLPVPTLALSAVLGSEMAAEAVLVSQRAVPTRLLESGYVFEHPDLESALRAALAR